MCLKATSFFYIFWNWGMRKWQKCLNSKDYKGAPELGGTNMVGKWEPLFTCSKNCSKNNVKVAWYWNKYVLATIHQSNFKIIRLKRLKQLFTKLIWPFQKRLNWPGRLAGISEGQSQKWCQISLRIFCVLPGTKNLQWPGSHDQHQQPEHYLTYF